jgi:hypothetical protein
LKQVIASIINPTVLNGKFSFEILLKSIGDTVHMGNSSFVFRNSFGKLRNPRLVKMNPLYDSIPVKNSPYASPILAQFAGDSKLILQLKHQQGTGNFLDAKDLLAKIELDIVAEPPRFLHWDRDNSAIVEPNFNTVATEWEGDVRVLTTPYAPEERILKLQ